MDKHINFLLNVQQYSQLLDQSQTIKSIKTIFAVDKQNGDLEHFEKFLNEVDQVIDEKIKEMKKALQVGA